MSESSNYDDIINEKWPENSLRPRMALNNRAKIFLPFAALKGFEKEIEKRRLEEIKTVDKREGKIKFYD